MDNLIYAYTREDALNDGVFVDVTSTAKEVGFKIPVAITSNLFHTYIKPSNMPVGQDENGRLWDLLWMFYNACKTSSKDNNMVAFKVIFDRKEVTVWGVIEAQSMTNHDPAINLMLPEDY